METVAVAVAEATAMDNLAGKRDPQRKSNRIQVSNTKKPLFFYLNLAKVNLILSFLIEDILLLFFTIEQIPACFL